MSSYYNLEYFMAFNNNLIAYWQLDISYEHLQFSIYFY